MRVQHAGARGRRGRRAVAGALGLLAVAAGIVVPTTNAEADTITVPFQDRLGCIAADGYPATSSPVFSKAGGSGAVADGATMTLDSAVSAYPVQPGVFSAVANPTGSFGYGSFGQEGYGASSYYSGANGIGFSSVDSAAQGTLTITLPYPQRVQFTVGGIDAPSDVDVSGTGPDGAAVLAQSAAKSTAAGAATTQTVAGTTARIAGATLAAGTVDNVPGKAVDVWFDAPVTTLTFRISGDGSGRPADGGFLVTPPLGCQSGAVQTTDATATATDVRQADDGTTTVTYGVPLTTTVRNTAGAPDMTLLPTVRSDLRAQVEAAGGTLDALTARAATAPACTLPADALPSGHLLGSTGPLGPQASCTQTLDATVTLPLDAADRTRTVTSTLASSSNDTYARVKGTDTATLTFPAVRAALTLDTSGTTSALPGTAVERTVTVTSTGPDPALRSTVRIDAPRGFPADTCSVSGVAAQPSCDDLLSGAPVDLGTLPAGATRTVTLRGTVPAGTAPGTAWPLTATASSPVDPTGAHTVTATLEVAPLGVLRFRTPEAGSSTIDRRPTISGTGAVAGATVTVTTSGGRVGVCVTTAAADGSWSCEPGAFRTGLVTLAATQAFGGIRSDPVTTSFTVTKPAPAPPTQPGGAGGAPGVGGGSSGGAGGSTGGSAAPGTGSSGSAGGSATPGTGSSGQAGGTGGSGAAGGTGPGAGSGGGAAAGAPGDGAGTQPTSPSGGATDDGTGAGGGGGGGGGDDGPADGSLGMDLRFGTQRIAPGTAADMRGTLGPNESGATVAITFQARISTGMVYRSVDVRIEDQPLDCSIATTSFSCLVPLDPGQRADVAVRVAADPVNAPDTAVQQISVASNRSSQANAMTVTTAVAAGPTEASELADQITTFTITEFPGAMVPLLSMLLFALAATVAGRRSSAGPAAGPASQATGTGPPGPTRASRPTDQATRTDPPEPPRASSPTDQPTDRPSGSNR